VISLSFYADPNKARPNRNIIGWKVEVSLEETMCNRDAWHWPQVKQSTRVHKVHFFFPFQGKPPPSLPLAGGGAKTFCFPNLSRAEKNAMRFLFPTIGS